jgi:hypothetical protein
MYCMSFLLSSVWSIIFYVFGSIGAQIFSDFDIGYW